MADFGLKIAKQGANIDSTNIDDYILWTKYPTLSFLEKKTTTITATDTTCSGTESVSHNYGFIPLVLGTVSKTGGVPTGRNDERYFMPADEFADINCDAGLIPDLSFNYQVKSGSVDIIWRSECVVMGSSECPLSNQTFTVDLYFFMWELGTAYPF